MANTTNETKSLRLKPDDFEPDMYITPFSKRESSGVVLKVIATDYPDIMFAKILPGGHIAGAVHSDMRYDSFRRLSDDYINSFLSFELEEVVSRQKCPQPTDLQVSLDTDCSPVSESEQESYSLVVIDVGKNLSLVAKVLCRSEDSLHREVFEEILELNSEPTFHGFDLENATKLCVALEEVGASVLVVKEEGHDHD